MSTSNQSSMNVFSNFESDELQIARFENPSHVEGTDNHTLMMASSPGDQQRDAQGQFISSRKKSEKKSEDEYKDDEDKDAKVSSDDELLEQDDENDEESSDGRINNGRAQPRRENGRFGRSHGGSTERDGNE